MDYEAKVAAWAGFGPKTLKIALKSWKPAVAFA
jgi:hypothetical protein